MTKGERLLAEQQQIEHDRRVADLLGLDLVIMDATWQVRNDRSVYIYREISDSNHEQLWFVFNDQGLYYSFFTDLQYLMMYIENGDASDRWCCLDNAQMREIDGD